MESFVSEISHLKHLHADYLCLFVISILKSSTALTGNMKLFSIMIKVSKLILFKVTENL
jgi:hypothetical protein